MSLQGFCCLESRNVPIGIDRRCLTDQSFAIAPSTSCAHRQWLGVDGWSRCSQERPCTPRPADAWRAILKQQAGAVRKREAARETVKPGREFVCCECARSGLKYGGMGRCSTCYQRQRARMNGAQPKVILEQIPCPVCSAPFIPHSMGDGRKRKKSCSVACGRVLRNRAVTASKQPARPPEMTASGREVSQIVPSICTEHRQEMSGGRPIRTSCQACAKQRRRLALGVEPRPYRQAQAAQRIAS